MPKKLNQTGYIPVALVLSILFIATLTIYAALKSTQAKNIQPSPTPIPIVLPSLTPSPSPLPSPSLSPSPSPKPSILPSPVPKPSAIAQGPAVGTPPSSGYAYITVHTDVGDFPIHVITMQNPKMVTDTADDSDCTTDCKTMPLADFVSKNGGFAGINGSYFCPETYPDCGSKKNSFDLPVYNSRLSKWINQDKMFWDGRSMIYQDGGGYHYKQNAKDYGGSPDAGITNYPGVLDNGHITIEPGSLSDKEKNKGTKGGLGLNGNTVHAVIAPNVTMFEFAKIFQAIGDKDAMNLDGGGSTALYFGGYKAGPGRNLPNAVIFK